jgi:hypothetical protein
MEREKGSKYKLKQTKNKRQGISRLSLLAIKTSPKKLKTGENVKKIKVHLENRNYKRRVT